MDDQSQLAEMIRGMKTLQARISKKYRPSKDFFKHPLPNPCDQIEVDNLRHQNISMRNLLDQNEAGFFSRFTPKKKNESRQENEHVTALETKIASLNQNLTFLENELLRTKSSLLKPEFLNLFECTLHNQ